MSAHTHDHAHHHEHDHTLRSELIHHLPYAIFSAAFSLIVLSFVTFISQTLVDPSSVQKSTKMLFHSFHFMHIVFAATGTLITFLRFSHDWVRAILVGTFSPIIFCTLSDSILPYWGGRMLGVPMSFHLCFWSELNNVLPFLFVGIINGIVLANHHASRQFMYSIFSHFIHIFVSSLACSLYLISHGFTNWYKSIGVVFLFLIGAVVVPCTLSDVVVPMAFARRRKKHAKH